MSLLSIAVGCLGGLAASVMIFGEVKLMTLIFGASLVGISIDYGLHFFCERFRFEGQWQPRVALQHIMAGITLGLVTSVIGFAGLLFAPFPGMQEMAVFSSAGLIFAYGCVIAWYPLIARRMAKPPEGKLLEWAGIYGRLWAGRGNWRTRALISALVMVGVIGCLRLEPQDDIRLLQTPDPAVLKEELQLRAVAGRDFARQFFLVHGRDEAELLEREEFLTSQLRGLREKGLLEGHLAISDFLASAKRQKQNRMLLAPLIAGEGGLLSRIAQRIGLPEKTRKAYTAAFSESAARPPVSVGQWLADPVSKPYRHLWLGTVEGSKLTMVALKGARDTVALEKLAARGRGVSFIDPAGSVSDIFGKYRFQAAWLTLVSYVVVTLLLLIRYGMVGGLAVMAAPVISAFGCFAVLGLLGEPLSLFNIMALLLVLGIGVDYGLFFRETGLETPTTLLAIAMSFLTTLLGFGLLAFSSTAAVHAFGLTILIGISFAFVFAPLAGAGKAAGAGQQLP
jgi:predicted exporter